MMAVSVNILMVNQAGIADVVVFDQRAAAIDNFDTVITGVVDVITGKNNAIRVEMTFAAGAAFTTFVIFTVNAGNNHATIHGRYG